MESDLGILALTAATIGFVHTITGPDHYLPFIVIGRARRWSLARTLARRPDLLADAPLTDADRAYLERLQHPETDEE